MQSSFENTDFPPEGSGSSEGSDSSKSTADEQEAELRRQAVGNLHARRNFMVQLAVYVLINGFLLWSWASNGFGFPWPLFVLVFWGIGLFWQAWSLFGPGESEDRVTKEMDRLRGRR